MITTRGLLAVAALLASTGFVTPRPVSPQQSVSLVVTRYERARVRLPSNHVQIVTTWYDRNPSYRPHPGRGRGRGRGGGYPPGWDKHVRRHAVVPVSVRSYYAPAPVGLVRTMPALPRGYEYALIGNRLVVLERPSWVVLDVLVVL